jgi:multidrug resistance efflux pump
VTISSKAVNQAEAHLKQADSAVRQAEASLALIDTQIAKLTVYAPNGWHRPDPQYRAGRIRPAWLQSR